MLDNITAIKKKKKTKNCNFFLNNILLKECSFLENIIF